MKSDANSTLAASAWGLLLPTDCKKLFNECATSESRLAKVVTHTRAVFDMLVGDGVIGRNPAKMGIATVPKAKKKPTGFYIDKAGVSALLAAAKGREYRYCGSCFHTRHDRLRR